MPTNIKLTHTDRGFVRGDFRDANGDECSIQESSVATEPMLWLGQDRGSHHHVTGNCLARMHLTQEMVADLIPMLQRFIDHGDLPCDDSADPDDPDTIPPEVSRLMDLQEEVLNAARDAGRPELRAAIADLWICDDVGLVDRAHRQYAWLAEVIRKGAEDAGREVEIDGPKEGG